MNISRSLSAWFSHMVPITKGKDVVIVAGMPKSGTTAIAQLLASATGSGFCNDPFYQLDSKGVKFRDDLFNNHITLDFLMRRYRKIFFSGSIIKDPNFPFFIGEIKQLLPEARFVSIIRDPRDNIRSVLDRLMLPGKPSEIDLDRINISPTWRNVLMGENPYIPGKDYIEVLARRWRISAESFLKYQESCIGIRYEDFKLNKAKSIAVLAEKLGYKKLYEIDHLVNVQFQMRGNPDVHWGEFFGNSSLRVIENITYPVMREFGYEPIAIC